MGKEQEAVGVQEAGAKSRREALKWVCVAIGAATGGGFSLFGELLGKNTELRYSWFKGRYVEGGLAFTKDGSEGVLRMQIQRRSTGCGWAEDVFPLGASGQKGRQHSLAVGIDFDQKEVYMVLGYRREEGVQEVGLRRENSEAQENGIAASTLDPKMICIVSFAGQDIFDNPVLEMRWKNWKIKDLRLNGQEAPNLYEQDNTNTWVFQVGQRMCFEPAPVKPKEPKDDIKII